MLIQVVTQNVEKKILAELQEHHGKSINRNILQCKFSSIEIDAPKSEYLIPLIKGLLADRDANLLYCEEGDLLVQWSGTASMILKFLEELIRNYAAQEGCTELPEEFFHHYDFHAHGEELRSEFGKKLPATPAVEEAPPPPKRAASNFSDLQKQALTKSLARRATRTKTEILIVEDQPFSSKLLVSLLSKEHVCHVAANSKEALDKYAEYGPDITLLDVELPDGNGHELAALFKRHDLQSFIVMVTANNYAKDVEAARANKVQGFIVKPYNKLKVLEHIENYRKLHRKGH